MDNEKCRVCLNKEVMMISIYREQESLMISTKIMSLARVEISPGDGLPTSICPKCLKKLKYCSKFVKLCQDSDRELRRILMENDAKDTIPTDVEIDLNYYNEDLNKFSPKSDTSKHMDCVIDGQPEVYCRNETEIPLIDINLHNVGTRNGKKREKQQCFTCGKVLSSRFRLKTHLLTHTGERPYSCPHCSKNFSLAQNLKVHLRIHTCDKVYRVLSTKQEGQHCKIGSKPLRCAECGAAFAHSAGLAAHRRAHSGLAPYRCALCPRSFRTHGHLQYHTRRHTGEKNFECDTCPRSFITRSDLKQHLLTHAGVKAHVCSVCGARLSRASHLKRHMQFIHKNDGKQEKREENLGTNQT